MQDARAWARKVRTEFDLWAESKDCDIYRKNNLYDMQSIAYQGYLTDGDSFAVFRRKTKYTRYAIHYGFS